MNCRTMTPTLVMPLLTP